MEDTLFGLYFLTTAHSDQVAKPISKACSAQPPFIKNLQDSECIPLGCIRSNNLCNLGSNKESQSSGADHMVMVIGDMITDKTSTMSYSILRFAKTIDELIVCCLKVILFQSHPGPISSCSDLILFRSHSVPISDIDVSQCLSKSPSCRCKMQLCPTKKVTKLQIVVSGFRFVTACHIAICLQAVKEHLPDISTIRKHLDYTFTAIPPRKLTHTFDEGTTC